MKVTIAIDSWKGCLSSSEANEAARRGLLSRWPNAEVRCVPVSDGGEGFLDAMMLLSPPNGGGSWQRVTIDTFDPLMRPIKADYLICGTYAVIEMAQASGLTLLKQDELDPMRTTTYGTGQLIADAVRRGAKRLLIGLGGSATSDCGMGMLNALRENTVNGKSLNFTIVTDVTNPLLGQNGAAYVFARQKGATDEMLIELETRARMFAEESARLLGHDCSNEPGAGAAGGVGYALMQYFGANRVDVGEFLVHSLCEGKESLIITGEGRADRQTLMGKLPFAILQKVKPLDIPVVLLAGQVCDREALLEAGFSQVLCVNPEGSPLEECLRPDVAYARITETVKHIIVNSE